MDRRHLVVVGDAATHSGESLRLQLGEKHLLSNAIGLQSLTIDIEADLLLLLAINTDIGHRLNAAETVAKTVCIVVQFMVATLVACQGNEKRRGISKVIVGHQCQHSTWEARLKQIESVLDFTPHFILIVHLIIQAHHDDALTILGGGCSLHAIHFLIGEEVALQRLGHLLLYLL